METPFSEGFVHAFAVLGETVTLVDTGNPGEESFYQLKSQLKKHGLGFKDFDHIVLTHMHTDHSGGVSLIQQETALPVYVHELAKPVITGGIQEFQRINEFFRDFLVQCGATPPLHKHRRTYQEHWQDVRYLTDGDYVHIGGDDFAVMHVPGHSQTDILLWSEQSGTAFMGDHLIAEISVNAFIEPPPPHEIQRPVPLIQYQDSLERVMKLPITLSYSGHGKPFHQHAELVKKRLAEHENRCRHIHNLLTTGKKSIFGICEKLYPRLKGKQVFLGLSQIQGHLDLMELRNQVAKEENESVIYYHIK
jgi:glyoxylase-like metal-dependent hydrolase (beta-lactamase superfamily II)